MRHRTLIKVAHAPEPLMPALVRHVMPRHLLYIVHVLPNQPIHLQNVRVVLCENASSVDFVLAGSGSAQ